MPNGVNNNGSQPTYGNDGTENPPVENDNQNPQTSDTSADTTSDTTTDNRSTAADNAEEYVETGTNDSPQDYTPSEDSSWDTSYDDGGDALSDDGFDDTLYDQSAKESMRERLQKHQQQVRDSLQSQMQQAQTPEQLADIVEPLLQDAVVEDTIEDAQEALIESHEDSESESQDQQKRLRSSLSKFPPFARKQLLQSAQRQMQRFMAQTEDAAQESFIRRFMTKTGTRIRQEVKRSMARMQESSNKFVKNNSKNSMEGIYQELMRGKVPVDKGSKFNRTVAEAQTNDDPATPEELARMRKNAPEGAKKGVAGEKELSLKEQKQLTKQFSVKDLKKDDAAKRFQERQASGDAQSKTAQDKSLAQSEAHQASTELDQPSLEQIARNVVPEMVKNLPEVRERFERIAREKGEQVAALIIAGGQSVAAAIDEAADESQLMQRATASFNSAIGRVQRQAQEGQREDAEWSAWALGGAYRLFESGRQAAGTMLISQAQAQQEARINSNPANQTERTAEETQLAFNSLTNDQRQSFDADFEPGNTDGSHTGHHQHFDSESFRDKAGNMVDPSERLT